MKRIYFDYAATAPVDPAVKTAMMPYFSGPSTAYGFGNPSSLHFFGQKAQTVVDQAREKIANILGANFNEIIFTGSATEANNLALRGAVKTARLIAQESNYFLNSAAKIEDKVRSVSEIFHSKITQPFRIIISLIEHESILETARDLEKEGIEVICLPVNKKGGVDLVKLKKSLNERTVLVSVMYANNEIGTIQPITEIAKIIYDFRNFRQTQDINNQGLKHWNLPAVYPLIHTDAVQAFQYSDCNVKKLGVDLMTLSGHKICGPKGVGALYVRSFNPKFHILSPVITGGGQEFDLRSGTENVPLIAGLAKAAELVVEKREKEIKRLTELKKFFLKKIKKFFPKARINGGEPALPNILNIWFPGQAANDLLIKLDLAGIAVSIGSACSARAPKDSYVLKALGLPLKRIRESLRFSFGRFTIKEEVQKAIKIMKKILKVNL